MRTIIILGIVFLVVLGIIFGGIILIKNQTSRPTGEDELCSDGVTYCTEDIGTECSELGCPSGTKYVGSLNSDKYYECRCGWAKNIAEDNIVCFQTKEEAILQERTESLC